MTAELRIRVAEYHVARDGRLPSLSTPIQYLLAGNGLFKRAGGPYFEALVPVRAFRLPDLATLAPGVTLKIPRLPAHWLAMALERAQQACAGGLCEAMFQVVGQGRRVSLVAPAQQATGCDLRYQAPAGDVLCDLHSHHVMSPTFSATDDGDEGGLRFYAVIGRIFTRPTIRLRVGVYGQRMALPAVALFAGIGFFADAYYETEPRETGSPLDRGTGLL